MDSLKENIERFLAISSGDGDGDGYGYGSGDGDGDGDGYGYGSGSGYGSGDGDGDGYGYGDGYGDGYGYGSLIKYDGEDVHYIDGLPTIISSVHGTFAKGAIVNLDFALDPCFIARVGDSFAHGQTLAEAHRDATSKHTKNMPIEDRIALFNSTYPDRNKPIPAKELFDWHNILTGSCLMGRKEWCRSHGINIERDSFTVNEFIKLTKNSYGSEIIIKL